MVAEHSRPQPGRLQDLGYLQERVYKKPIRDLVELKQRLLAVRADFEQTIVDKAIDQWRKRLVSRLRKTH